MKKEISPLVALGRNDTGWGVLEISSLAMFARNDKEKKFFRVDDMKKLKFFEKN